jgi:hypothetical protein
MRLRLGLIFAIAIGLSSFSHASAQSLWQSASFGDSLQELQSKFPQAVPVDKPVKYEAGLATLMIDQHQVGGEMFDVMFVMAGPTLHSVHLVMSKKETGKTPFESTYRSVEALLHRKYGTPLYDMPAAMEDPDFLRMLKNEFRDGDLTITLLCMMCDTSKSALWVSYELDVAADSAGF